jgi:uncharacterized membrane protein YuzA (DUF378 family)
MRAKMENIIDHLYPIVGGLIGSIIGFFKTGITVGFLGFMTAAQFVDWILITVIGVTVGWVLKRLYDYLEEIVKNKFKK